MQQSQQPVILFSLGIGSTISGVTHPPLPVKITTQQQATTMFMTPYVPQHWQLNQSLQLYLNSVRDISSFTQLQAEVGNNTGGFAAGMVRDNGPKIKEEIASISNCLHKIDQDEASLTAMYNAWMQEMALARGDLIHHQQTLKEDNGRHAPLAMALLPHLTPIFNPSIDKTTVVARVTTKMRDGSFPLLDPMHHESYEDLCKHTQDVFGLHSVGELKGMIPDKKAVLHELLVQLIQHGWDKDENPRNAIQALRHHNPQMPVVFHLNICRDFFQSILVHQLLVASFLQLPGYKTFLEDNENYKNLGCSW